MAEYSKSHYSPRLKRIIVLVRTYEVTLKRNSTNFKNFKLRTPKGATRFYATLHARIFMQKAQISCSLHKESQPKGSIQKVLC